MSEPTTSGTAEMAAISDSKPIGGKNEKPLTPSVNRQQNAAALQQIIALTNRLKSATEQIDAQNITIVELQNRDEENKQAINKLTLRIDSCEKSNKVIQATLDMVTKSIGIDLNQILHASDTSGGTSAPSHAGDLTEAEEEKVASIVKAAILRLYGMTKFSPKDHGIYPLVSKDHMEWPHKYEGNRRVNFHRFNFGKDFTYASPCNNDSFQAWIDLSLSQGAVLVGGDQLPSRVLNRNSVTKHCITHFRYLQRRVREYFGKDSVPVAGIKRRGEGLDEPMAGESQVIGIPGTMAAGSSLDGSQILLDPSLIAGPVEYPPMAATDPMSSRLNTEDIKPTVKKEKNTKENMRSRSQGKLAIRTRKRNALEGINETYKLPKYDGFFTIGGTSDDEAVDVTNEKGEVVEEFHARPWAFASDERVKCQVAVDATQDPQPNPRQTTRRRGTNMVDTPPISKIVKTGVLSWMVKPEILKKNPQWLTQHRVYPSGPEWGEEEPKDPPRKSKASKRVKLEDVSTNLDQIHKAQEEFQVAQQRVDEYENATLTEGGPANSGAPM
ncbi:hypothetical protein RSOLAG22IIIB_09135 [Rhizoctonia solani]|uniref:Uncharacterized protein n=1 Tax=Rhizoctonia solani TaxID=456999 RepID=A0A0K6FXG3_9AGAM|nr:hypothetical protein RSOLAG22IIIB_09135 [Rhizoctonia solani]